MVSTLLRDTDAMSMAHSLEVRVPFLDHSLVESVARLPESAKRNGKTPKSLLVGALQDLLPDEVVHQQRVWSDFLEGRTRWSRVWSLFVLNRWVKQYLHTN